MDSCMLLRWAGFVYFPEGLSMFTLLIALAVSADPIPFDPEAKPNAEVIDILDADGDGMALDSDVQAAVKHLSTLHKSRNKTMRELAKRLDIDGDEEVSVEEAKILVATARMSVDQTCKTMQTYMVNYYDADNDGVATKQERIQKLAQSPGMKPQADKFWTADEDRDGNVSRLELALWTDAAIPPNVEMRVHPGKADPTKWQIAVATFNKADKTKNKRLSEIECKGAIRDNFKDIDADGSGDLKVIELFNWMLLN